MTSDARPDSTRTMLDIAVIGCGAVGGAMAAVLDRAGHRVTVTARGRHLKTIQASGLRMTGAFGDHIALVRAVPTLTTAPDLAIIATKAQDAPAALSANAAFLRGVPVIVVQNGLAGPSAAQRVIPDAEVFSGTSSIGANVPAPGGVNVTTPGLTVVCPGTATDFAAAEQIAAVLETALPVRADANTTGVLWTKLIVNQVNALPAITGLSIQQTIDEDRLRRVLTRSMREAVRVARHQGVRFGSVQGIDEAMLAVLETAPVETAEFVPRLLRQRMGSVPNTGSTLQSVASGRPTEIDHLHGAVVAAARESSVGVTHDPTAGATLNELLVSMVHEVENSDRLDVSSARPRFLTVDEVIDRASCLPDQASSSSSSSGLR